MAIKATFDSNSLINGKMQEFQKRFEQSLLLVLNEFGMELVNFARLNHNYKDQTGNLTNSFGYVVVKGKRVISRGGQHGGGEGEQKAIELGSSLAKECSAQYSLIIVAGMNYASYVESKGYNVLIPSEVKCDKEFSLKMKNLVEKYNAIISRLK